MFAIVYALVAVALLVGFVRIVRELRTGQFFVSGWKGRAIATRENNPILYWLYMTLEILVAALITSVFVTNCLKELDKR